MMTDDPNKTTLSLSTYLIVFIDLLGQSTELAEVTQMPSTDEEKAAANAAFNRSASSKAFASVLGLKSIVW